MAVADGSYIILTALDPDATLDVQGGSGATNANIWLYGVNYSNAQVWDVRTSGGKTMLRNIKSGLCLYPYNGASASGTNIVQNGASQYVWVLANSTAYTVNGTSYTSQTIKFQNSSGCALDCTGGASAPTTNIWIYTANSSTAQNWIFIPYDALKNELATPADIQVGTASGTAEGANIPGNGVSSLYPSWVGTALNNDVRYRIRTRAPGGVIGDWGNWLSLDSASSANLGWGTPNSVGSVCTQTGGRIYAPTALTPTAVNNSTVDYEEIQIEARTVETGSNYGFHGASGSQLISLYWEPTLTISAFAWTPLGMRITYSSDYLRSGNTIRINNAVIDGHELSGTYEFSNQPASGTLIIPVEDLGFIPDESDPYSMSITLITDKATVTDDYTGTITYGTSAGITVTPAFVDNADYSLKATVTAHDSDRCFLRIGDSLKEMEGEGGVFTIYPPLNTAYTLYFVSTSGASWGMAVSNRTGPDLNGHVWNWPDGCAIISAGIDDRPVLTDNAEKDASEIMTTGREYPVYRVGASTSRDLSVTGAYLGTVTYNTAEDFDALLRAKHAIFRTRQGGVHDVAILGVSKAERGYSTAIGYWGEVTVSQREETP